MSGDDLAARIVEAAAAEARRRTAGGAVDLLALAEADLGQGGSGAGVGQGHGPVSDTGQAGGERWVTLREASEAAGVSVSALRKAYREERIDSRLEPGPHGEQRIVELGQVLERMGRGRAPQPAAVRAAEVTAPPGTMLVPQEAWERVLSQLGHLHDAGQQLAEARERAAKAETEAAFLRERLAELRARLEAPSTPTPAEEVDEGRPRRWWRRR